MFEKKRSAEQCDNSVILVKVKQGFELRAKNQVIKNAKWCSG
jgi:hypothetical protein